MKRGLLIIMSGPSGVGKGTVRQKVMEDETLNLAYSISMTTRGPRAGEENGREYFFVTKEEFEKNIKEGNLLEYNFFVSNYYGTPKSYVDQLRNEGKNVLLEIDVNGAKTVMAKCKEIGDDVVSFFILPPSMQALENRIRGRRSEPEDVIQERLSKAAAEIDQSSNYKYPVVNDNLEETAKLIRDIIVKESNKNSD
ncbi:MAG: guanylate kinase [Bacilli bacterium]|nr:guanylate kinase [Bacilli bacterium]